MTNREAVLQAEEVVDKLLQHMKATDSAIAIDAAEMEKIHCALAVAHMLLVSGDGTDAGAEKVEAWYPHYRTIQPGDTLYAVDVKVAGGTRTACIKEQTVKNAGYSGIYLESGAALAWKLFGKLVFLKREEAEAVAAEYQALFDRLEPNQALYLLLRQHKGGRYVSGPHYIQESGRAKDIFVTGGIVIYWHQSKSRVFFSREEATKALESIGPTA